MIQKEKGIDLRKGSTGQRPTRNQVADVIAKCRMLGFDGASTHDLVDG